MPIQLIVIAGPDQGRTFPLATGATIAIGRGEKSTTHLVDAAVSRIHCEVQFDKNRAIVTDAKSASGTFVNGQKIATHELKPGDVIRIGDTQLRYENAVAEDKTILPADAAKPATKAVVAPTNPTKAAPTPPGPAAPPPVKEVVFANKPGGRVLPKPLKDLCDLAGKSLGNFQLLSVLGVGQVGVVFQARDTKDQKILALKVLRADFAKDQKAMQRFVRGMMSVRTVSHPNLIELYNAGITAPYAWMAMEFIDGSSLAQIIQQMAGTKERDWRLALSVAIHITRALGSLHQQNMIHRAVMPQNIMVQKSDKAAKLGDAMLAKALEGTEDQNVTSSGEFVGNLYYMAPERTMKNAEVDGRADLYSLGVTLYFMVTGKMPVEGKSMPEVIMQIRNTIPESPRKLQASIPAGLDAVILEMLAKQPGDRFQTAKELLAVLEKI